MRQKRALNSNVMPLHMTSANRLFVAFILLLGVFGALLGYALAFHPKLESFKLLNIVGLSYDFIGILVLSEAVAQNEKLKAFIVKWVAGVLLWAQTVVPLGALIGALLASAGPSSKIMAGFSMSFWAYSILLLVLIDSTVFFPRSQRLKDISLRIRTFGIILLISGVIIQIVAAFKDLYA